MESLKRAGDILPLIIEFKDFNEIERVFLYFSNEENNCKYNLYGIKMNNRSKNTGEY
jgi:hypothetical protein